MTDPERQALLEETRAALEEARERARLSRDENRRAHLAVLEDRARRAEDDRRKVERVLARLREGANERAICAELHVSPKRVVRLRATLSSDPSGE